MRTRGLSKSFGGTHVLKGVTIEISSGDCILLRGENGSGKTTLLNVLSGWLQPDEGSIEISMSEGRGSISFEFGGRRLSSLVWIIAFSGLYQVVAESSHISGRLAHDFGFCDWLWHSAAVFAGFVDKLDGGLGASDLLESDCSPLFQVGLGKARWFWGLTVAEGYLGLAHVGALITLLIERLSRR